MTANAPNRIAVAPSARRNVAGWITAADIAAVALAASLPWSTSLVAIFAVIWALLQIPAFDFASFRDSFRRPSGALPVLLFALAVVGTLWATDTPWATRLQGINPVAKLLAIPVLIYHFRRSDRSLWVAAAFLASCTAVMLASWSMFINPRLAFDPARTLGVPVKNYIVQGQEFALCAFGALGAAIYFIRIQRKGLSAVLMLLSVGFLANMLFVASSRTALVCIPVLLALFAAMFFDWRGILLLLIGALVATVLAWHTSPYLRMRADMVLSEYQAYHDTNAVTSTGQRLEYWRKSLRFIEAAPVVGHGTGSTKALFERDAVGKSGVSAEVIGNPHNQTLNVMVQWGLAGAFVLYAMWFAHLKLFAWQGGLAAWIGLVAVVENFASSLLNSHLFDFAEGWMYVLAVGVAGGIGLRRSSSGVANSAAAFTEVSVLSQAQTRRVAS